MSKQETSFGTEENYKELLVKYNSLLTTLGEVAAKENNTFDNQNFASQGLMQEVSASFQS